MFIWMPIAHKYINKQEQEMNGLTEEYTFEIPFL